jgi:hypothetical protein
MRFYAKLLGSLLVLLVGGSLLLGALETDANTSNVISIWKPVNGNITSWPCSNHACNAFDIDGNDGETAYLWAVSHPFGDGTFAAYVSANFSNTSYYRNVSYPYQTLSWQDRQVNLNIWHTVNGQWVSPVGYISNLHLDIDVSGPSVGSWIYNGWTLGTVDTLPGAAQSVQWATGYPCYGDGNSYKLWQGTPGCSSPWSNGSHVHWAGDSGLWNVYHPYSNPGSAWHHFQP